QGRSPILRHLPSVAVVERRAHVLDCSDVGDPSEHIPYGGAAGRRAGRDSAALDENVLSCRVLEPGSQDPVHLAGLAGPCRVRINGLRADLAADGERDDDEAEPPEGGSLPVTGAPAAYPARAVGVVLRGVHVFLYDLRL